MVYRTEREKFNAVIEEIKEYHLRGQPVLVGTIAIEKSEKLSAQLRKTGLLPSRLQELLKAAGLEGPKLSRWATAAGGDATPGHDVVDRAGSGGCEEMLEQKALPRSLARGGSNGNREAFLQALLKRAHEDYAQRGLPPADEAVAPQIAEL